MTRENYKAKKMEGEGRDVFYVSWTQMEFGGPMTFKISLTVEEVAEQKAKVIKKRDMHQAEVDHWETIEGEVSRVGGII